MNHLFDAAMYHADFGRPAIGVNPEKKPYRKGWNQFFTRAQTEDETRTEFSNGAYGIALVLYPACDRVVLDYDGLHAESAWLSTGISIPETARHITQSGGQHFFFKQSNYLRESNLSRKVRLVKADCNCKKDGQPSPCGVDLLINGYAIIPPTPGYHEDPDHPFEDAVEIPDAIVDLARASNRGQFKERKSNIEGGISQGERNAALASLAGSMRRRGMSYEAILAALREENERKCNPPLDAREVEAIARSISNYEPAESIEHLTDLGNARRFAKQHRGQVRYCFERDQWFVWTGSVWTPDNTGDVMCRAKETVLSIYTEAANEKDPDRRAALAQHAVKSETNQKIQAILSLAKSEPGIPVMLAEMDHCPFLFNVQSGVIDLDSGSLLPHDPNLLITQISPCHYNPDASCDLFISFLQRIMNGNNAVIEFLQRFFGYCLTGDTSEHAVIFAYGGGANGKSTLFKAVHGVMGSYADMAAPNLLLAKRSEEHPAGLADLVGKRLVCTVEIEDGRRFDAALFKWLSGGDVIKARFMRENFFSFTPTHKLAIAANHKPTAADSSDAFWRRMKIIPFNVKIPVADQDKHLDEKLKGERDGILAWMVRGAVTWRKYGLGEPKDVVTATDTYRSEQDFLAPFLSEYCTIEDEYRGVSRQTL